jgi:hypothetical protein
MKTAPNLPGEKMMMNKGGAGGVVGSFLTYLANALPSK